MDGRKETFWAIIKKDSSWRELILSIGTHKHKRRLSPIEVARTLDNIVKKASKIGISKEEIAKELQLRDTSMIYKFLSLLNIPQQYHDIIVFGNKKNKLSFSSVVNATHLSEEEMIVFLESILSYNFTREETRNIKELKKRTQFTLQKCVDEVLLNRPIINENIMFMGLLINQDFINKLNDVPRNLKNIQFTKFLEEQYISIKIESARVTNNRFILITSKKHMSIIEENAMNLNKTTEQYIREEYEKWWYKNVI